MLFDFCDQIKEYRENKKYSRRVLSERSGVSLYTIENWETDPLKNRPHNWLHILRLAYAFELNLTETIDFLTTAGWPEIGEQLDESVDILFNRIKQEYNDCSDMWGDRLFQLWLASLHTDGPIFEKMIPQQHPPLFDGYIPRPEMEKLIEATLKAQQVLLLTGLGGIGKSTLAVWTANQLADSFTDGVIWIDCQPNNQVGYIQETIAAAYQVKLASDSLPERSRELRTLLRRKNVLLVLDNLWYSPELFHLTIYNENCPMLITTRHLEVANFLQTVPAINVGPMNHIEAEELLIRRLQQKALSPGLLEALINRLAGLPLALSLAGSLLQQGYPADKLLAYLSTELEILDIGEAQIAQNSLKLCFDLSYQALRSELQPQFSQLGCFVGPFTETVVSVLWNRSLKETRRHLSHLVCQSLLNYDSQGRYRLHSLLADYARQQLSQHWPDLERPTRRRQLAFYIDRVLYHPQLFATHHDQSVPTAPDVNSAWPDIIASLKWAQTHDEAELVTLALLLAHTERPALVAEIGPGAITAIETMLANTVTPSEKAILHELGGKVQLLQQNNHSATFHFEQASQLWRYTGYPLVACRVRLRLVGLALLTANWAEAATLVRQIRDELTTLLSFGESDKATVQQIFYLFNTIYLALVRWPAFPEEDVQAFAQLATQTGDPKLQADGLRAYRLWCTAPDVTDRPRQKAMALAVQAACLWRHCGPDGRRQADIEVTWTQYRLKNRLGYYTAKRMARRMSAATPAMSRDQAELLPGLKWWLSATERQRIGWLSFMLPRYHAVDNRPPHPTTGKQLSVLPENGLARQWVRNLLQLRSYGKEGRRLPLEMTYPDDCLLSEATWNLFTGRKVLPLTSEIEKDLVVRYLDKLQF